MIVLSDKSSAIDLDRKDTWPREIFARLGQHIPEIAAEKAAQNQFDLSDDRWTKPCPQCPRTDEALWVIKQVMSDRILRVFHATRLLDPNALTQGGLLSLSLSRQISLVRDELVRRGWQDAIIEFDEVVNETDLESRSFAIREKQVWFTPMRRLLHDGGCDVFFEHFGGEAIQRLTQSKTTLAKAIRSIGDPAVVVGNIPAFGICLFGDYRVAPAMLSLMLEDAGFNFCVESWDVLLKRDVPPEWIEAILPHDHPDVA